ncbi:hypothetical protein LLT5_11690 [Lactococcus cremoris subsp. cremoris TIFN5]|nr:hypothetical protein LLT5_11690 [Lactococcus cremoris subsp. cremoris TIFN5]EQC83042.1 hypothetical protein LLT1_02620 [Lactococcus cremoris subsp. cremoris TIFN1]
MNQMMKKIIVLLLISGFWSRLMLLQQQEDTEGEEIEAQELAVILEVETLTAIIIILVPIIIALILEHLEWEEDIVGEGFGSG